MPKAVAIPSAFRPYVFHGVLLEHSEEEGCGDCPFCNKSKFYVSGATGQYDCKSCGEKGNGIEFLRKLHEISLSSTKDYDWIVNHRGIKEETLVAWGVCKSYLLNDWIVPGYLVNGKIGQLYRYVKDASGRYLLLATPTFSHGIYGYNLYDPRKKGLDICEGPWDGMALWERLGEVKESEGDFAPTSNESLSLRALTNVVAVPGCTTFPEGWARITDGKDVRLLYDNDYPRTHPESGKEMPPAGYYGMNLVTGTISSVTENERPASIKFLKWGTGGYTTERPSGFDVRDLLKEKDGLRSLFAMLTDVPPEWVAGRGTVRGQSHIEIEPCTSWQILLNQWKLALYFTKPYQGALAVVLAAIASVKSPGEQLWLKLISPPSSGKTVILEAASVAKKYVITDSGMNGFFSGYKTDKEGTKDHSLASRLYDKALVTKEGATLLSSPMKDLILSQARDLYDGAASKEWKNAIRREYAGLRFVWIIGGTPTLRGLDKSELGQRLFDYVLMDEIDDEVEDEIISRGVWEQSRGMLSESNCKAETTKSEEYLRAMRMTGGYIEHLRKGGVSLLNDVNQPDEVIHKIMKLGKFAAMMRARPVVTEDEKAERELGVRLAKQFMKLAGFLAVVMNRKEIDEPVMDIVKKVANDTGRGRTMEIVKHLYDLGSDGIDSSGLARLTGQNSTKESGYLSFLRKLKVTEVFVPGKTSLSSGSKWRLTPRFIKIYREAL